MLYVLYCCNEYPPNTGDFVFQYTRNWQKNRRRVTYIGSKFCYGVDLNRNFGYKWGNLCEYFVRIFYSRDEKREKASLQSDTPGFIVDPSY